jgi:DNA-binding CsgD family transcriptional regulator
VQDAAAGLRGYGLGFEATLLLSEAATRSVDRRARTALLHLARNTRGGPESAAVTPGELSPAAGRSDTWTTTAHSAPPGRSARPGQDHPASRAVLSGRELQVARLLLRNQTYREIGERLFISPKTVEHHVARMKQRIGASRRSELFTQLRALTDSLDA